MSTDFRAGLAELAERVRRNPMLELLAYEVGEPVDEAQINNARERLGADLPEAVRRFYSSVGSAVLRWRFRPDLDERTLGRVRQAFDNTVSRSAVFEVAGAIEIVSLESLLFDEELRLPPTELEDETFDFDGKDYPVDEFADMLRPFDVVSDFFAMAFVVRPGDWPLMWLSDYWVEFDSSRIVPLDDYLRYVLDTWGLINVRAELFSQYRGDREPPMRYDPELVASTLRPFLATFAAD